jgi:threonine synthase
MGLPIDKLVVATNQNDMLHRFFETGIYRRPPAALLTIAPSMDISVPSNFERFLYYLADESSQQLKNWMEVFEATEELILDKPLLDRARQDFCSNTATKSEIIEAMRTVHAQEKYLVDPHTGKYMYY